MSEAEALILEASLVKKLQPKYNIDLKDDKSYPYIHISDERFPIVAIARRSPRSQASSGRWFGPYTDAVLIREALAASGYRLQTSEETDNILLSHGMTQGGQLGAADQAEICKWLGVERLFYGDINEFGEVMTGIYNRRMIKGR